MFSFLKKKEAVEDTITVMKACVSGRAIPVEELDDGVFSAGIMGKGIAIVPSSEVIVAPCNGEISAVMEDSGHAVGLRLNNGAELLIHEGLDTVMLNGEGFELLVKEGDQVKAGDSLIRFDAHLIESKGLNPACVFLLTNSDAYPNVQFKTGMDVMANETVVAEF